MRDVITLEVKISRKARYSCLPRYQTVRSRRTTIAQKRRPTFTYRLSLEPCVGVDFESDLIADIITIT